MKKLHIQLWMLLIALLAFALAGCSGGQAQSAAANTAEAYASQVLVTSYDGAIPVRNQLGLGTLALAGTTNEVTPEQAAALLPLWQALRGTTQSGGSAQAEVNALLEQIESAMSAGQLAAIAEMQLAQSDLQAWAKANGITLGAGSGQPGAGQGLSPEARATRQAAEGVTSGGGANGGGASTAILEAVISYLETLAQ